MNNNIAKNTLYYTIGEIVPRILSFILLPIFTLYLTAEEYGINSYLTSVMSFVLVFSSLSLNTFLLRNYYYLKSETQRKELTGTLFLFLFFFNIVLVVLQLLGLPFLISYFSISIAFYPYFFLIILIYFFESLSIVPLVIYRVKGDAKSFLILNLSKTLLQVFFVYIYVVILKEGLVGSLQARLLINVPFFVVYFYIIHKNGFFKINTKYLKQGLKFSLPLLPGTLSFLLISLSDRIIMERYISLDDIGVFSVAATLCLLLNVIVQALYKSFEPIVFKDFYKDTFQNTNVKLFRTYLLALFLGAFCIAIFSKEFFLIATSGVFIKGYKIVPYLIIAVLISGINTYYSMLLVADKKNKLQSLTFTLNAIINVALNFLFIPYFGFYGAIVASVISFLITNLVFQKNVKLAKKYFLGQLILAGLIVIVPVFLNNYINTSIFATIVIKLICSSIFLVLGILLFKINYAQLKHKVFLKIKTLKKL
jgi:O-antigen/teichoic acid export membrane protein